MLSRLRALIKQADPHVEKSMYLWSHDGLICNGVLSSGDDPRHDGGTIFKQFICFISDKCLLSEDL
jgi:hypothetical protein